MNQSKFIASFMEEKYPDSGPASWLKEIATTIRPWYDIKMRGIVGPGSGEMKKIGILNGAAEWEVDRGIVYGADKKHAETVAKDIRLGLDSKGVDVPGSKDNLDEVDGEELASFDVKMFTSIAARESYLAMERPDLQFLTKEIRRPMSSPKVRD